MEKEVVRGVHTLIAGVVQVYHRLHVVEEEEKGAEGRARRRNGGSRRRDNTHVDDHVDEVNGAKHLEPRCMCVQMKTRQDYLRKFARSLVDVYVGVRIVKCHASMDVVIDVRVVECHENIHVVIGVRVVLCHPPGQ